MRNLVTDGARVLQEELGLAASQIEGDAEGGGGLRQSDPPEVEPL